MCHMHHRGRLYNVINKLNMVADASSPVNSFPAKFGTNQKHPQSKCIIPKETCGLSFQPTHESKKLGGCKEKNHPVAMSRHRERISRSSASRHVHVVNVVIVVIVGRMAYDGLLGCSDSYDGYDPFLGAIAWTGSLKVGYTFCWSVPEMCFLMLFVFVRLVFFSTLHLCLLCYVMWHVLFCSSQTKKKHRQASATPQPEFA